MLGKPSRRERKNLEEHGKTAEAVVLEIAGKGMAITNGAEGIVANTELALKTRLRVEPEGEPPFEVNQRFRYPQLAIPSVGSRLTVRFDPENHDHIMIDRSLSARKVGNTDMASLLATAQALRSDPTKSPQDLAAALRDQLGLAGGSGPTVIIGGERVGGASAGQAAADPIDQLERLAKLRDTGVLTDEEFQAQKARILGETG